MSNALVPYRSLDREPIQHITVQPKAVQSAIARREKDINKNVHDVIPENIFYTPMPQTKPQPLMTAEMETDMIEHIRSSLAQQPKPLATESEQQSAQPQEQEPKKPRRMWVSRVLERMVMRLQFVVTRSRMVIHHS